MRKVILVFFISEMDLGTPLHFGRRNEKTPIFSLMTIFHIKLSSGDGLNYRRGLPTNCTYKPAYLLVPTYLLTYLPQDPLFTVQGQAPFFWTGPVTSPLVKLALNQVRGQVPWWNYRFISPQAENWEFMSTMIRWCYFAQCYQIAEPDISSFDLYHHSSSSIRKFCNFLIGVTPA